jgi:ubiquinone/menaquinone biosynthesis C-methylase UbiE
MPLINHFDLLAPFYDRLIPPPDPEGLMECIGLPVSGYLLDAGGGTGRVSQLLKDKVSNLVVADLSSQMLREAIGKNGLRVVQSQTESLPFPGGSFDRVLMVDAFHHVINHYETAIEMWRVVKVGGRIVFEEPNLEKPIVKFVALMEKLVLMRSHFLAPDQIADLFFYPNAQRSIVNEGITSWVIIDKK